MSKATRYPYQLITNQPTSTNYSSSAYSLINVDVAAIQIDYTGALGSFAVQGSVNFAVDNLGNVQNAGTFSNLPFY